MNTPSPTDQPSTPQPSETAVKQRCYRFRLWPALAVIGLGAIVQQALWWTFEPDRTTQIFTVMGAASGTVLGLILWWMFFSGLRWRTRLSGAVAVAVAFGVWLAAIRLEGFTGEMIPRLAWRWSKTSEERVEEFLRSRSASKSETVVESKSTADSVATDSAPQAQKLVVTEEDWPGYRGPNRDGILLQAEIRRDWDVHPPKLLWKRPVGPAWSSFAVVDGLAFTQEQRRKDEAVVCYDANTGNEIWVHTDSVRFVHAVGGDGPRATPTIYDGFLYSLGDTGVLNCLEPRTGEKKWSHDILADAGAKNTEWGTSDSPLVFDNVVVVNPGGPNGQGVVAYDRLTGEKLWSAGSDEASYASPQLASIVGVRQVLIFDAVGLAGHAADTGSLLWKFPWSNQPKANVAQPIPLVKLGDDLIFLSTGYTIGSAVVRVSNEGDKWSVAPVSETKKLKLKFNSAIERDGSIYGLDEGILCCFKAEGLKQMWKGGRYGYGELLLVDDVLLVQAESGEVALVEADPKAFREVTRFQALEIKTWNHPALSRGHLFVRNSEEAACYDISATKTESAQ